MAEEMDGEEFVVDKILDKRVRNGKIEYYLSWKVSYKLSNTSFLAPTGAQGEAMSCVRRSPPPYVCRSPPPSVTFLNFFSTTSWRW